MSRARDLADGTFSGEFAADSPTFVVDAENNRVGIGTSSPVAKLHLSDAGSVFMQMTDQGDGASRIGQVGATLTFGLDGSNGATERARIEPTGSFLVGTTSQPNPSFTSRIALVQPNANAMMSLDNTNGSNAWGIIMRYTAVAPNGAGNEFFVGSDSATTRVQLRSNGGIANFSANNVNLSDERVKTDIAPLGSYWDKIKALAVVTFKYNDQTHDDDNIGVIAQQVESVAPEFVSNDGFGDTPADGVPLKTVYEADLHYAMLKVLQEAMTRIETLEAEVAALKGSA